MMGEWSDWNEMREHAAAESWRRSGETSEETRGRHERDAKRANPEGCGVYEIVHNFMEARLPLDSVSSYQIRCVAHEIAQAIEAARADDAPKGDA